MNDNKILFKIQISACGQEMLTYNEDKTLSWKSSPDVDVIAHFFPDIDFPEPEMNSNGNIINWKLNEANTFDDLMKRKTYVWGHMDGTTIVFDKLYEGDHDLIGW